LPDGHFLIHAKWLTSWTSSGTEICIMAEAEQRHRHDIERTMARSQVAAALFGQVFAFLTVLAGFGLAAWLATGVSIADVAVIAGIFTGGRVKARKSGAGAESTRAGK